MDDDDDGVRFMLLSGRTSYSTPGPAGGGTLTSRGVEMPTNTDGYSRSSYEFPYSEYAEVSCGWVGRPVLLLCISLPLLPGLVKEHWTATGWLIDTNFFYL